MNVKHVNSKISEGIASRISPVCIINPVRMYTTEKSLVHSSLIRMMPDIADSIKFNEDFYSRHPGKYPENHVILVRDIPEKGYTVYTILLDKDPTHDNSILDKSLQRICDKAAPCTTFRLLQKSDVVDGMVWTWAKALLKVYAYEHDTMELYEGSNNEGINYCEKCVHKNVCKYLAIGGSKPQCEDFLSM